MDTATLSHKYDDPEKEETVDNAHRQLDGEAGRLLADVAVKDGKRVRVNEHNATVCREYDNRSARLQCHRLQ